MNEEKKLYYFVNVDSGVPVLVPLKDALPFYKAALANGLGVEQRDALAQEYLNSGRYAGKDNYNIHGEWLNEKEYFKKKLSTGFITLSESHNGK